MARVTRAAASKAAGDSKPAGKGNGKGEKAGTNGAPASGQAAAPKPQPTEEQRQAAKAAEREAARLAAHAAAVKAASELLADDRTRKAAELITEATDGLIAAAEGTVVANSEKGGTFPILIMAGLELVRVWRDGERQPEPIKAPSREEQGNALASLVMAKLGAHSSEAVRAAGNAWLSHMRRAPFTLADYQDTERAADRSPVLPEALFSWRPVMLVNRIASHREKLAASAEGEGTKESKREAKRLRAEVTSAVRELAAAGADAAAVKAVREKYLPTPGEQQTAGDGDVPGTADEMGSLMARFCLEAKDAGQESIAWAALERFAKTDIGAEMLQSFAETFHNYRNGAKGNVKVEKVLRKHVEAAEQAAA
jgi:hypothetical protein